ncbi:MAG: 30S ribosomal protein S9 [Candidatus Aenigmarchaeota archaeon]|nr:30S ribosomal protein S9 [Candidatus Aenigmarchaeota archaeon]
MASKVVHVSGKRKLSIARATVKEGRGVIRVNKKDLSLISPDLAREKIMEPLMLAGDAVKKVNIEVTVKGGGFMSQAEAVRNAIAKGLVEWTKDKELKKRFLEYDRHLIIADVRRTEPQKPCRSAARAGKQTSKR